MNLKELRNSKGVQRQFVMKEIDISGTHLNDIEAGRVNLTDKYAERLAKFYRVKKRSIKEMYLEGKNEGIRDCKKTDTDT